MTEGTPRNSGAATEKLSVKFARNESYLKVARRAIMKLGFGLMVSILIILGIPVPALANGDDAHLGGLHIGVPPVIAWVSGIVTIAVFLLFFVSWFISRRSRRQRDDR